MKPLGEKYLLSICKFDSSNMGVRKKSIEGPGRVSRHNLLRSTLIVVGSFRLDQFLGLILIRNEFPFANMRSLLLFGSPDLVAKSTPLALCVLVRTTWVQARIELARGLKVRELAVGNCAVGAVATNGHRRMLEGAVRIRTVREEFAKCFSLVCRFDRGRRMTSSALPVLACCSEGTIV